MKKPTKDACLWTTKSAALIAFTMAAVVCAQPAHAGKARDYLNAPKNTWITFTMLVIPPL
jgi:hypothetical protein